MKKRRTIIVSLLLVAALALGIGYAALSTVNLNITGTAKVNAVQENFVVDFSETVVASTGASGSRTGLRTADIIVDGLTDPGQEATVKYTIVNDDDAGSLYAAKITAISVTPDATGMFDISIVEDVEGVILQPGQTQDVTVKVRLEGLTATVHSSNINITFTVDPILPTPETT